ncbi:VPLPA-CTERM sorting domain-containing protein [Pseudosulfitobacter koreensis]|uniref:VPLPA-CTERM sorting domain-containing protein n=1 Tax=Pseudosulfitobacter koreensis TaxID=2968472 RepID=A0ABT1YWI5_9RHOB|nr:VPLPA-CTERM sorting domain-containing protein [Pseudosulfitobacter koreense]MCR8825255.1 VPLPA-CTERM sorting domain-containing protein [Pseudosulfitobacter koreense]
MNKFILATAFAIAGGAASAATISANFDLRAGGNSTNQGSLDYSVGDVSLSVTGIVCDDGSGPNASNCRSGMIDRSSVSGIYFNQPNDSDHEVDGQYSNEFLKLSFSPDVTLDRVKFSYWDSNDEARLYTLNGSIWNDEGAIVTGSSHYYEYDFVGTYTGSMFLLGAVGENDEWKLKGVTVDYTTPVPLPAAAWLLIASIGGLAAAGRGKKKSA